MTDLILIVWDGEYKMYCSQGDLETHFTRCVYHDNEEPDKPC